MKIKLSVVFILISLFSFSQTIYRGTVKKENDSPLENAIVIVESSAGEVISYTATNSNGEYRLQLNTKKDSLIIKASFLGYQTIRKTVITKTQIIDFILKESTEELKEVFVEAKPIVQKNDTLSYSISKFRNLKDNVIADVLKKMPGIEVQENGKILYLGKPIQKYYIEGLDLLEGKYNLANNNIPVDEVSKVQILENHQPIKLLDSLVFSDRASLNIKLKNKNILLGIADIGVGVFPFLWDVNITPMLFSKKKQFLFSYQSNNVGKDVADNLKTLTNERFLTNKKEILKRKQWVKVLGVSSPPFDRDKWLDNKAHLFSGNYLYKLRSGIELKANMSFSADRQNRIGNKKTSIFTELDTINIIESQENSKLINRFTSSFILEKNVKRNYFKNSFSVNVEEERETGFLTNTKINQQSVTPNFIIDNSLQWLFPFKRKVITLNTDLLYKTSNQNLIVNPGQFSSLLNNNLPYEEIRQNVENSIFYVKNYLGLTKSYKGFTYSPKIGLEINSEKLFSDIFINNQRFINNEFINNVKYIRSDFFIDNNINLQKGIFKVFVNLPMKWVNFTKKDVNTLNLSKLIFEPNISVAGEFDAFWRAAFSFRVDKNFGDLEDLYPSYLFQNYRSLNRYDLSEITETTNSIYGLSLSYKNPIQGFFAYGFFTISNSKSNSILKYDYDKEGRTIISSINTNQRFGVNSLNLRIVKSFSDIDATLSLSTGLSFSNRNNFINNVLTNVDVNTLKVNLEANLNVFDWLNIEWLSRYNRQKLNLELIDNNSEVTTLVNKLGVNWYIDKINYITFNVDNFFNSRNKKTSTFLNANYSLKGKTTTYKISWYNILNTKTFSNALTSNGSIITTNYRMRPSQVLFSAVFKL